MDVAGRSSAMVYNQNTVGENGSIFKLNTRQYLANGNGYDYYQPLIGNRISLICCRFLR